MTEKQEEVIVKKESIMQSIIHAAASYLIGAMKSTDTKIGYLRIEEIDSNKDKDEWYITLSFIDESGEPQNTLSSLYSTPKRIRKIVSIKSPELELISIKDRE